MPTINVGAPAPAFTLRDAHGERHSLSDFKGRSVVLYFYPEDDTPLCTAQACQFRDHHPDFTKIGCAVIGISPDDQHSHADFTTKHKLPFTLLVDEKNAAGEPKVSTLYGAWGDKNMYGNIVRAMLRTTYLIGPDGKVARRWDRVKTPGHAAQVLQIVKALHSGEGLSVLGEVKPLKKLSAKSAKPAKKRSRRQGGRAAYAGIASSKGKRTPSRSIKTQMNASTARSRPKKS
jgi:thioredoxin-dependent peroxiredoxin